MINNRDFKKGNSDMVLNPWWVTGIVDSEGNFSITLQDKKSTVALKVTQKDHSMGILFDLQRYFKCGRVVIDNKKTGGWKYTVTDMKSICNIIIPHFEKYPLVTSKHLDYLDFKFVVTMHSKNQHRSQEVIEKIKKIKTNMNSTRSFEQRWHYLNDIKPIKLQNEWVQGFIDGEGSFQFELNRNRNSYIANANLEIAQSSHDARVLQYIQNFFGFGYIKPKYDITCFEDAKNVRSVNRYVIQQSSKVIEFIDKYPLLTRKSLDYQDWKKLIELKKNKAHLTESGRAEILFIKNSMNKSRI
jgi:LAGLIDADG endonuclease